MERILESDYVKTFLGVAGRNVPNVRLFVRQVGAIKVDGRVFRAGVAGQADIWGVTDKGRHIEIEAKRGTKLSPAQMAWRDWCRAWNVPWMLLECRPGDPVDDVSMRWAFELVDMLAMLG